MSYVKRGTTPTHIFEVDLDLRDAVNLMIIYKQYGRVILEKTLEHCKVGEDKVSVELTQSETLSFKPDAQTSVEIIARFSDGTVARSDIMTACIKQTLLEGEL